jgi:hypothetical protein
MGNQDPASTFFEKIALFGRRSTFYSVFQNKTEFKVKILTNPEPYTGHTLAQSQKIIKTMAQTIVRKNTGLKVEYWTQTWLMKNFYQILVTQV